MTDNHPRLPSPKYGPDTTVDEDDDPRGAWSYDQVRAAIEADRAARGAVPADVAMQAIARLDSITPKSGYTASIMRDAVQKCREALAAPQQVAQPSEPFQPRVKPWLLACFGEMIAGDKEERNHRFLEEALELVQACGCTEDEARQLVSYVYGRPVGEPSQEVGGVMVTLAALCLAHGMDMHGSAETELARIWTKVEQIRAKQAAKPKHSPLPMVAQAKPEQAAQQTQAAIDVLAERQRQISAEGWTPEHDDEHREGSLARAGGLYALNAGTAMFFGTADTSICETPPDAWPWKPEWWKPKTARRDLVKAGALILSEIERLDRAAAPQKPKD